MSPLNSAATSARPPANSYRKVEDQFMKDMDRRDADALNSGKKREQTVDTNNAVGVVQVTQQEPEQTTALPDMNTDSGTIEQNTTVQATDNSLANGAVGILEGFEAPTTESDGAVIPLDFAGLLNEEIQTTATAADADFIQAGTLNTTTQPTDSLENTNNTEQGQESSLLHMMQGALARAPKSEQTNTNTQQDEQPDVMDDAPTLMPPSQDTRTDSRIGEEFRPDAAQQPPQVTQADMDQNVSRLVESIQANAAADSQEFMVHLKPEFLGKLSIKLVMDGEGLHAQIKAQDMNSKSLILHELPALEAALKEKGLDVRQIEVAYEAPQFDFNPQQNFHQSWQFSQDHPKGHFTMFPTGEADTVVSYFELTSAPEHYLESSSVEFSA